MSTSWAGTQSLCWTVMSFWIFLRRFICCWIAIWCINILFTFLTLRVMSCLFNTLKWCFSYNHVATYWASSSSRVATINVLGHGKVQFASQLCTCPSHLTSCSACRLLVNMVKAQWWIIIITSRIASNSFQRRVDAAAGLSHEINL